MGHEAWGMSVEGALLVYSVIYVVQAWMIQDIPPVSIVKWIVLGATAVIIYGSRDTEPLFNHHLPH
jgi:hypothetical protein